MGKSSGCAKGGTLLLCSKRTWTEGATAQKRQGTAPHLSPTIPAPDGDTFAGFVTSQCSPQQHCVSWISWAQP
jgi:hypothetical protein